MTDPQRLIQVAKRLAARFPPWMRDDLVGDGLLAAVKGRDMRWAMIDTCRSKCINRRTNKDPREVQTSSLDIVPHPRTTSDENALIASIDLARFLGALRSNEAQVVRMRLGGCTNPEIAQTMSVSRRTVWKLQASAYAKIMKLAKLSSSL